MSTDKRAEKQANTRAGRRARKRLRAAHRRPPSAPAPVFIVALSLAREMAAAVDADREDRGALLTAALAVGEWLAGQGRPGRWDTIDVKAVLGAMAFGSEVEEGRFLLALAGLLGYAGVEGHLPPAAAWDALTAVAALAGDPIVKRFAQQTARQFQALAA